MFDKDCSSLLANSSTSSSKSRYRPYTLLHSSRVPVVDLQQGWVLINKGFNNIYRYSKPAGSHSPYRRPQFLVEDVCKDSNEDSVGQNVGAG